jgi:hypothetical protein
VPLEQLVFCRSPASLAILAQGHYKSNTKRDARQAEYRYDGRHNHSNLLARFRI